MSHTTSVTVVMVIVGLVQGTRWTKPVNTTQGLVRGIFAEDGDYSMYLGIPYAKVNEENPFGAADSYPPFDNIFDATNDSVMCPQENEFDKKISGTLDCLHIHISVPNTNTTKLPVLVYIYGGYLTIGFAGRYSYGGRLLVKHDIIVVSFNYRLGPYGFMCLDTEEMPGNQGLRDQHLALRWIKENIEAFGGDPDKITVMGNSAGSMSIDFHLISDFPKLFHQGILESGVGSVPEMVVPSDNTVPFKLSKYLGFETNNMTEAISYLATVHPHLVIDATIKLKIVTRVCVEKKFENVEPFLSVHPEYVEKYDMKDINILGGFNDNEMIYFFHKTDFNETFFRDYLGRTYRVDEIENMVRYVRRFYIGDEMITKEVKQKIIDFTSDMCFIHPVQRTFIKYMQSGAKVYQYLFSYDGGRNFEKVLEGVHAKAASHADELGYLFDMVMFPDKPTPEDQYVIDVMTTMWANFVKYGNPTPETSELIPVIWRPASIDVIHYLEINSNLTTGISPYHERISFWDMFTFANRDKLLVKK